jgi:hypothetical protein
VIWRVAIALQQLEISDNEQIHPQFVHDFRRRGFVIRADRVR